MSEPKLPALFSSVRELEDAAEELYLSTEFVLGAPTYPELAYRTKVRLRQSVIQLRLAGFRGVTP